VAKNLEKFYFKAIHRKFRRLQKRKYIKGIVKGYRQERRMRRIVEEWKKAVDLTKFETEEMKYQM
jgi:methyl coenzyme M reductase alpha subunit